MRGCRSPEQADGVPGTIDPRSDIYALGVVLYQTLTGRLPFQGTIASILAQVQEGEPAPPRRYDEAIPIYVEVVCLKAMAREPSRRYGAAAALAKRCMTLSMPP